MRLLQLILGFGLVVIGLLILIIPVFYWINNPGKTEMEIFILFWDFLLIGIVASVVGLYIIKE